MKTPLANHERKKSKISVVVPVYNEVESLKSFVDEVVLNVGGLGLNLEVILVVDPSNDGTEKLVREICSTSHQVYAIFMTRRFGQPVCTFAGLEHASGDAVIVMDSDFQDPPHVLPKMIRQWQDGSLVVMGKRVSRSGEAITRKYLAKFGYAFLNRFAEVPIPRDIGDFRLIDRRVLNSLLSFEERLIFLRGLVTYLGYPYTEVEFQRPGRSLGKSKYNRWTGSIRIALDGIVGFSNALLRLSTLMGFTLALVSILAGTLYGLAKLNGFDFPIGNPTIVVLITFLSGLNLLSIGILGLYVGRIFDEVKKRPRYIVLEKLGF